MRHFLITFLLFLLGTAHAANYLTFTAEADSSAFGIHNVKGNDPDVQYSLDDGKTWTKLKNDTLIPLPNKKKALLRGHNPQGISSGDISFTRFVMTGRIAASGSVMSLIDGKGETTVIPNDYCFYKLFSKCESLTQAPQLPATTQAKGCYQFMFLGCTNLTQAPELPATTLADYCYKEMFKGCTSLTQAPKLPATTLAESCYAEMFSGCTELTQTPELPATQLADWCYYMMFSGCTNLTQASELPATHVNDFCYDGMFSACPKISKITVNFTEWGVRMYGAEHVEFILFTTGWLDGVAPQGTFICPKKLPKKFGWYAIPKGWKVVRK